MQFYCIFPSRNQSSMNIFCWATFWTHMDPHVLAKRRERLWLCRLSWASQSHMTFESQIQICGSAVNALYLSIHCTSWAQTLWRSRLDQQLCIEVLGYLGNEAQHLLFLSQGSLSISDTTSQRMLNNSATTASFCFVLGGRHRAGPCPSVAVLRGSQFPIQPEISEILCPMTCFTMTQALFEGFDWLFLFFPHQVVDQ